MKLLTLVIGRRTFLAFAMEHSIRQPEGSTLTNHTYTY